jgi:hypothetical protein
LANPEELMTDLPYLSDFANGHYLRGLAAGEARAVTCTRQDNVLIILDARSLEVSEPTRSRIRDTTDRDLLDQLVRRATVVDEADELFV